MASALTANEEAQLLSSIEMFEVITTSDPNDYQSLEILKEAYSKLGREEDVVNASKRIAKAYVQSGQLTSAIFEYESILQRRPNDEEVLTALQDIEKRANSFSAPTPAPEMEYSGKDADKSRGRVGGKLSAQDIDDGRQGMYKLFVDGRLISATDFDVYWPTVDLSEPPAQPIEPFIGVLAAKALVPVEQSLKLLIEKSRLGFLPLEKYDIDVELARKYPKDVCRRWGVLPFDSMSKAVLVATANPFNKQATRELEAAVSGRIVWYLTPPNDLMKALKKSFR